MSSTSKPSETAALYRRYPELFDVANTILDVCFNRVSTQRALWFANGRWTHAALYSSRHLNMPQDAVLAGVYNSKARAEDIVRDMLAAQAEIMETA